MTPTSVPELWLGFPVFDPSLLRAISECTPFTTAFDTPASALKFVEEEPKHYYDESLAYKRALEQNHTSTIDFDSLPHILLQSFAFVLIIKHKEKHTYPQTIEQLAWLHLR